MSVIRLSPPTLTDRLADLSSVCADVTTTLSRQTPTVSRHLFVPDAASHAISPVPGLRCRRRWQTTVAIGRRSASFFDFQTPSSRCNLHGNGLESRDRCCLYLRLPVLLPLAHRPLYCRSFWRQVRGTRLTSSSIFKCPLYTDRLTTGSAIDGQQSAIPFSHCLVCLVL